MGYNPPHLTRLERFLAKVQTCEGEGCWEWMAGRNTGGYGSFYMGKAMLPAHRAGWILQVGPLPDPAIFVCHKCDNRICVRLDHLFLGTREDNRQDCIRKGRQAKGDRHNSVLHPELVLRGEACHSAKTNEQSVREMRLRFAAGESPKSLMAAYQLSSGTVSQIVNGKAWKHVETPELLPRDPHWRCGEGSVRSKLTNADVVEIRRRYTTPGATLAALGRDFGVQYGTIRKIIDGRTWKHLAT